MKIKKLFEKKTRKVVSCISLALALCLGGCSGSSSAVSQNSSPLRVGVVVGGDSYAYMDGSNVEGLEIDLARGAANAEGAKLEIIEAQNTAELLEALDRGTIDVAFGRIASTDPSIAQYKTSRWYGRGGYYFVTERYDFTDSLASRPGAAVGVCAGAHSQAGAVPFLSSVQAIDYSDVTSLGSDISSGTVELGICSQREAKSLLSDELQSQEVLAGPIEQYVAVFPKENLTHVEVMNQVISEYLDSAPSQVSASGNSSSDQGEASESDADGSDETEGSDEDDGANQVVGGVQ